MPAARNECTAADIEWTAALGDVLRVMPPEQRRWLRGQFSPSQVPHCVEQLWLWGVWSNPWSPSKLSVGLSVEQDGSISLECEFGTTDEPGDYCEARVHSPRVETMRGKHGTLLAERDWDTAECVVGALFAEFRSAVDALDGPASRPEPVVLAAGGVHNDDEFGTWAGIDHEERLGWRADWYDDEGSAHRVDGPAVLRIIAEPMSGNLPAQPEQADDGAPIGEVLVEEWWWHGKRLSRELWQQCARQHRLRQSLADGAPDISGLSQQLYEARGAARANK